MRLALSVEDMRFIRYLYDFTIPIAHYGVYGKNDGKSLHFELPTRSTRSIKITITDSC